MFKWTGEWSPAKHRRPKMGDREKEIEEAEQLIDEGAKQIEAAQEKRRKIAVEGLRAIQVMLAGLIVMTIGGIFITHLPIVFWGTIIFIGGCGLVIGIVRWYRWRHHLKKILKE